jgi:hypothetical protein
LRDVLLHLIFKRLFLVLQNLKRVFTLLQLRFVDNILVDFKIFLCSDELQLFFELFELRKETRDEIGLLLEIFLALRKLIHETLRLCLANSFLHLQLRIKLDLVLKLLLLLFYFILVELVFLEGLVDVDFLHLVLQLKVLQSEQLNLVVQFFLVLLQLSELFGLLQVRVHPLKDLLELGHVLLRLGQLLVLLLLLNLDGQDLS